MYHRLPLVYIGHVSVSAPYAMGSLNHAENVRRWTEISVGCKHPWLGLMIQSVLRRTFVLQSFTPHQCSVRIQMGIGAGFGAIDN